MVVNISETVRNLSLSHLEPHISAAFLYKPCTMYIHVPVVLSCLLNRTAFSLITCGCDSVKFMIESQLAPLAANSKYALEV